MKQHPDEYNGLLDWEMYGPRDPEITQLVYQLAYGKQLRLVEIENVFKDALLRRSLANLNGTDDFDWCTQAKAQEQMFSGHYSPIAVQTHE